MIDPQTATISAITSANGRISRMRNGRGVIRRDCNRRALRLRVRRRFLEAVADAADGVDEPVGAAELFADGGDVDVDGAVGDEDVGTHGLVYELVAREDAAAGGDEGGQELELGERQPHRLAV